MVTRVLVWLLALCMLACGSSEESTSVHEESRLADLQAEIDGLIEVGHALEPLPTISSDEMAELEVRMHRSQVADEMRSEVAAAVAPLAVAAALFAPEGAVEFVLVVVPVERIGQAALRVARKAMNARKRSKQARELVRLNDEFQAMLDARARDLLHLAGKVARADRRALRTIFEYTKSPEVVERLLYLKVKHDTDVRWIAGRLEKGRMDYRAVERFTFDAGLVEDITLHDSGISWNTLQRVVDGSPVSDAARAALAGKMRGLMGERAARDLVNSPGFMRRHLERSDRELAAGLGVTYRAGPRYHDERRALDILAFSREREAVFVEVKTWSSQTWSIPGQADKILAQLRRHDEGIAEIVRRGDEPRTVKAKVLMVEESGYEMGMDEERRAGFKESVVSLGWVIETIPADSIPTFGNVIDSLR